MNFKYFRLIVCLIFVFSLGTNAKNKFAGFNEKETYIPKKVGGVPADNDYSSPESKFNYYCLAQSRNIVVLWDKDFGNKPLEVEDEKMRFNTDDFLKEGNRFYRFYVDKLKFVDKGNSLTDKYKMLLYIFRDNNTTAYGWGEDNKVGVMWFRPPRIQKYPYCTLAHELGHSFQFMIGADGAWGYSSTPVGSKGQSIAEMTSQWMLWQVYPDWMTIENYHLKQFLNKTHYALMHETNQYHSPYVLEYWSTIHGLDFISKIWKSAKLNEDVVSVYKRITGISQEKFNDEIYDAASRFVTWDLARVKKVAAKYANIHSCKVHNIGNSWFQIAFDRCPQNYGYNAIQLEVPSNEQNIVLDFKGLSGAKGFRSINTDNAGWRYGFLAVKANGKRIYGKMNSKITDSVSFQVPTGTKYLWLIVTGAPTVHWPHIFDNDDANDEQWPYQFKISGTKIHNNVVS